MSDEPETNEEEEQGDESLDETKSGRSSLLITAVASVVVAGVAGGAAFVLTPSKKVAEVEGVVAEDGSYAALSAESGDKKSKKKKKLEPHTFDGGELQIHGDTAYFVLDPLTISIRPIANTKHLRVSIVLETSLEEARALLTRIFHVRDILNTYLRSVDNEAFENPAAMSRLRTQIRRRIHAIAPEVTVDNVLITEFILT